MRPIPRAPRRGSWRNPRKSCKRFLPASRSTGWLRMGSGSRAWRSMSICLRPRDARISAGAASLPWRPFTSKKLIDLPENGGLEALEKALTHRLYTHINEHVFERPDERTLIYRMSRCRVQEIRNRKGMADYPCKSGGVVEYSAFARAIDPAIVTECLACPPDPHPESWFCSWKFTL